MTGAFDDERDFFGNVATGAGRAICRYELHVDIDTAFRRVHPFINNVFDEPVRGALNRHVMPFYVFGPFPVFLAILLG